MLLGEGVGAALGLVEHAVGAGLSFAVDERLEIPGDVLGCGHGHAPNVIPRNEHDFGPRPLTWFGAERTVPHRTQDWNAKERGHEV